ncbi:MAG: GDSL-type esterase/lipase family protein [Lacipirellulaceae bacterium]
MSDQPLPLRIACVGASVVFGRGLANRRDDCYPAVLQRLLDTSVGPGACAVRNFGYSGATASDGGNEPFARTPSFTSATRFRPQRTIVTLGTNDAQRANEGALGGVEAGLRRIVEHFRALAAAEGVEPLRAVLLSQPAPAFPPATAPRTGEIDPEALERVVRPAIARVAAELGAPCIDFDTPLRGRGAEFPDGLHPTAAVAAQIARIAHDALLPTLLRPGL